MTRIFRIIPLDSKGEQDANEWFTDRVDVAMKEAAEGNSVSHTDVKVWQTTIIMR